MSSYTSWAHGNCVRVETTENLARADYNFGWGADLLLQRAGLHASGWFHLPIPTPNVVANRRLRLQRVFLSFSIEDDDGEIRDLVVYDGPHAIRAFTDLDLDGDHLETPIKKDIDAHTALRFGVGISFRFVANTTDSISDSAPSIPPAHLIIGGAGAEFTDELPLITSTVNELAATLHRQ